MKTSIVETKTILFLTILILLFATRLKAQSNFSGTWIRNTDKCELVESQSINSIPFELIIKQSDAQLEITRNSKNGKGDSFSYTENAKFDGSSFTEVVKPNLNKKAKISLSTNHQELILTADYTDDQGKLLQQIKETWTLLDNGKTLVIKAVLELNGNGYPMIEVFDKK